MARAFYRNGYDVLAWNYRGCSDEMNRQLRFYHSGATDDLQTIVGHAGKQYYQIFLVGFSLGGNLTLKYLGEPGVPASVKKATVFSVPIDLYTSCLKISRPGNWMYTRRFLNSLKKKVRTKASLHHDLNIEKLDSIKTLLEFDDLFTGPIHGFQDALDYYTKCSSLHFIAKITIPTLIVSARNDPFLSPECYPCEKFEHHEHVTFEFPGRGGHVGFTLFDQKGLYWSEMKALSFVDAE